MVLPGFDSIHFPLLIFLPCLNILSMMTNHLEFKLKVLENKMAPFEPPSDLDNFKMYSIELDFRIYTCNVVLRLFHFAALLYVRGFNFNLFDLLFLGKASMMSFTKMLSDFSTYLEYRCFLTKLNTLMLIKEFDTEEICPIC